MDEEVENERQPNQIRAYNVYNEKLGVSNCSHE
jgi:hypothetical protein